MATSYDPAAAAAAAPYAAPQAAVPAAPSAYAAYPAAAAYGAPAPAAPTYAAPSPYAAPAGYAAAYAAPAPYGAAPQYGIPPPSNPDEPRTLFVTGFPTDVKERELNNLLRFLPGYEVCDLARDPRTLPWSCELVLCEGRAGRAICMEAKTLAVTRAGVPDAHPAGPGAGLRAVRQRGRSAGCPQDDRQPPVRSAVEDDQTSVEQSPM